MKMNVYGQKPSMETHKARIELLGSYADAAGFLYGVLSVSEFVGVFNHYEVDKTDESECFVALQEYISLKPDLVEFSLWDELVVGSIFNPEEFPDEIEVIDALRAEQSSKPRYLPPSKVNFLNFVKGDYIEPVKPYNDLKTYIIKNNLANSKELTAIDYAMLGVYERINEGTDLQELIDYFIDMDYRINDIDAMNAFLKVLMEVYNNTRMIANNGFTPNQLQKILSREQSNEPEIYYPKKVGRNDSCPCGSGKKYKRCCALIENSGVAQLSHDERRLFYETWYKLLDYVNRELKVVNYKFSLKYPDHHDETLLYKIRQRLWENPAMISDFITCSAGNGGLTDEETALLLSWESYHLNGNFALVKYRADAAILMLVEEGKETKLYAVKGMTTSIAEAMLRKLPVMLDTVLLPFKDKIIYDSFMASHAIEYGEGVMAMFTEQYNKSEMKYGIADKLD